MSPEQMIDVLECQHPKAVWDCMIAQLKARAQAAEEIAVSLERDAKDASERADEHYEAAQEFHSLALALERAPVTFSASAGEAGTAETVKQGSVHEHAVGNAETPNPKDQ